MGLDMYLTKETYVKNWDHMNDEELHNITIDGPRADTIKPERISYIVEEVGYWRKANAIHNWFVENCQDGVDECQKTYVSRERLQELLNLVNRVLEEIELIDGDVHVGTQFTPDEGRRELYEPGKIIQNPEVAHRLLPTQSGFFFGGTDYDEWYVKDLESTRDILTAALQEEHGEFYYQSSW